MIVRGCFGVTHSSNHDYPHIHVFEGILITTSQLAAIKK
jgi:hypothetical protein